MLVRRLLREEKNRNQDHSNCTANSKQSSEWLIVDQIIYGLLKDIEFKEKEIHTFLTCVLVSKTARYVTSLRT